MNDVPLVGSPGIKEAADRLERECKLLKFQYPTGVAVLQRRFVVEISTEGKAKFDRGEEKIDRGETKIGCFQILLSPWMLEHYEPEVHLLGVEPVRAQNTGWEDHLHESAGEAGQREGRLILDQRQWIEFGWTAPQGNGRAIANAILNWFIEEFLPRLEYILTSGMIQPAQNSPIDEGLQGEIIGRSGIREWMEGTFGSTIKPGGSYVTHEQHEANEAAQREEAERARIQLECSELSTKVRDARFPHDLDDVKGWFEREGFSLDSEDGVRQSWPEPVRRLHESFQMKHVHLERATVTEDEGIPEPPTGGVRARGSKMSKLQKALLRMEASRNRSERVEEEE